GSSNNKRATFIDAACIFTALLPINGIALSNINLFLNANLPCSNSAIPFSRHNETQLTEDGRKL
ncbi:hypothetical protein, partial [Klebsiella pneumoniae]|uniref:hypothetical protein n=1 Tax=Klebsiella pneumoniae TaxID=573 RepID=UPI002731CDD2